MKTKNAACKEFGFATHGRAQSEAFRLAETAPDEPGWDCRIDGAADMVLVDASGKVVLRVRVGTAAQLESELDQIVAAGPDLN